MPESEHIAEQTVAAAQRRRRLRRLGCAAGFMVWLLTLAVGCLFVTLALQEQIVISQGSAPNQEIRLWLISEPEQRGLALSTTSTHPGEAGETLCLQTNVNFLLWTGESSHTAYCECYAGGAESGNMTLTRTTTGPCSP